jgi:hypothetical protein
LSNEKVSGLLRSFAVVVRCLCVLLTSGVLPPLLLGVTRRGMVVRSRLFHVTRFHPRRFHCPARLDAWLLSTTGFNSPVQLNARMVRATRFHRPALLDARMFQPLLQLARSLLARRSVRSANGTACAFQT